MEALPAGSTPVAIVRSGAGNSGSIDQIMIWRPDMSRAALTTQCAVSYALTDWQGFMDDAPRSEGVLDYLKWSYRAPDPEPEVTIAEPRSGDIDFNA